MRDQTLSLIENANAGRCEGVLFVSADADITAKSALTRNMDFSYGKPVFTENTR